MKFCRINIYHNIIIMSRTDNYILRITNTTLADGLTISNDNSFVSTSMMPIDYGARLGRAR
jgi:hypothetical protein